jgi:hypothetical protein
VPNCSTTACRDPDEARERISALVTSRDRLLAAAPRLKEMLSAALATEQRDRWWSNYKKVKAQLDEAVLLFHDYREHAQAIVDMFSLAAEVDREVSRINGSAPDGEHRRLRSVELTARTMTGFTRDNPALASTTALPDWNHSARNLWPARPSTTLAVMAAGMNVPHPGGAWSTPEVLAEKRAQAEKENAQMAAYHDQAAKDEQDRINRQEVERFREAHPQQR